MFAWSQNLFFAVVHFRAYPGFALLLHHVQVILACFQNPLCTVHYFDSQTLAALTHDRKLIYTHCSEAWLGLLRLPLPSDLLKKVLVQLHSKVMPSLANPLLLSDFLSSCLDQGGLLGMLALNALFTLVTKHGLEYPHFYARLYALLQVRDAAGLPLQCVQGILA